MALPTVQDLKDYLRIETDAEDTLLAALLVRAKVMLQQWTDTPIAASARTYIDPPSEPPPLAPPLTQLVFPWRPINPDAVTVVDADGTTVDDTTYRVDARSGMLIAKRGVVFTNPPYEITAEVGFVFWDDYATLIEPLLGQVIIDLAADLYARRTPMATSETGAGTTISWDPSRACVERSLATLKQFKLPVAG